MALYKRKHSNSDNNITHSIFINSYLLISKTNVSHEFYIKCYFTITSNIKYAAIDKIIIYVGIVVWITDS